MRFAGSLISHPEQSSWVGTTNIPGSPVEKRRQHAGKPFIQGYTASKLWIPDSYPESRTHDPENDSQEPGLSSWDHGLRRGTERRKISNSMNSDFQVISQWLSKREKKILKKNPLLQCWGRKKMPLTKHQF